ncbi:MAG TPA: hypothetical protein VJU87_04080 [Gemmatimonadaceae bacterium]|nr:hypothetical protein [Gemmatimonadaceae bacterium]
MQRSKQQALMFLLGAVLVGGVLGFSAERVLGRAARDRSWAPREAMYDDVGLSAAQRTSMDSVLDASNAQREALIKSIRPQLDSLRIRTRTQMYHIFTPQQRARFEARVREDSVRRAANHRAREQKKR